MRRTRLVPAPGLLLTVVVGLEAFSAFTPPIAAHAVAYQAGCAAGDTDAVSLVTITEPAGATNYEVTGPAPLTVGIAFVPGVISYPAGALSLTILWGDGATTAVTAVRCGEDEVEVPAQTMSHTYTSPGQYFMRLDIDFPTLPISPVVGFVIVNQSAPTVAPTATPVPPTSTPIQPTPGASIATPTPGPSTPSATSTRSSGSPTPIGLPVGSPTATTGGGTPTPQPSPSASPAQATATPTVSVGPGDAAATPGAPEQGSSPPPGEPDILYSVESPQAISTDPAVVATNLVIAGCTVWVLFTSVLLNQVLDERRGYLDAKLAALKRAVRRGSGVTEVESAHNGKVRQVVELAAVFLSTGLIYSFLQPDTGLNRATAVMLTAAIVGSAGVALFISGLKAAATRRRTGMPTAIRAYPLALAVAVASVVVSRVLGLSPGVMYGFVASCVVLGQVEVDRSTEGRITIVPVVAGLVLAALAWLGFGFLRSLDSGAFVAVAAEATLIVIFIEGVEGITLSLVPVSMTDGGKLFSWNRLSWAAIAMVSSFAAWHVLVGRDRQYFGGLREAQSMTVLLVFVVYSALTLGLWLWLRNPRPSLSAAAAAEEEAGPA